MKHYLKKIFFFLSPLLFYTISGNSMLPVYKNRNICVIIRLFFKLKPKDVVILTHPQTGRLLLKRIKEKREDRYFVVGDNETESTDSRDFGWVKRKDIVGKVIYKV